MSNWPRPLLIGVLTLIVGLIVKFPARVAYHWFAPADVVAIAGIQGTVWTGSAQSADLSGIYVGDLEWSFQPLKLFTGKAAWTVSARPQFGTLATDIAVSPGGTIRLTDLESNVSLQPIGDLIGVPGLRGTAAARFERLEISDGYATAADGSVDVRGLIVPLVSRDSIGDYRAEFFTQEAGVIASVEDTNAVLDIAGRLTLGTDRSYELLAQLAPKPETPEQLRQQIQFLPSGDAPGRHELRLMGEL